MSARVQFPSSLPVRFLPAAGVVMRVRTPGRGQRRARASTGPAAVRKPAALAVDRILRERWLGRQGLSALGSFPGSLVSPGDCYVHRLSAPRSPAVRRGRRRRSAAGGPSRATS